MKALEAFHVKRQRQILRIRWFDFVSNVDVQACTGLTPLGEILAARRFLDTLPGLRVMFLRTWICRLVVLLVPSGDQARIKVGVGPRHCTTVGPSVSHLSPSTHC